MLSRSPSPPLDPVSVSEDLTPLPNLKQAGNTRLDFDGQLSQPLAIHEDVRTGCGGQTWPAGLVLGKHMLRYQKDQMRNARMYVVLFLLSRGQNVAFIMPHLQYESCSLRTYSLRGDESNRRIFLSCRNAVRPKKAFSRQPDLSLNSMD